MGLDQYLYATKYLSDSKWLGDERNEQFQQVASLMGIATIAPEVRSANVQLQVAYWRKANAVHQWFVDNCQDGVDDCRESYVGREQLTELLDICNRILADRSLAEELLPTQSGFFFGSTEYDEWYFGDIEDTVTQLRAVLSMSDEWSFQYQSSW